MTFNRTHYFIDKGQERGLTYEALKSFENDLNADLKTGNLKVHVVIVPMSRDLLAPSLLKGKVDMIAAMVTVRPELEAIAAFSEPTRTDVNQVVVTGPGAPAIAAVDDLAGQAVFVRKASAYYESISKLNAQLKARGKPVVIIDEAPDVLEDDDILEMVNAGLAPITVVDDYLAEFWGQVFTGITVHKDVAVRTGGRLAVAFRKDSPKLREAVNEWIQKLSNDELAASRDARAADPKAAAALQFARAVVQRRGDVRDQDLASVRAAGYTDGEIAEIIAHVALNVFTNYFNRAAQTDIDFPLVTAGQLA